jgi:hypothetical protein
VGELRSHKGEPISPFIKGRGPEEQPALEMKTFSHGEWSPIENQEPFGYIPSGDTKFCVCMAAIGGHVVGVVYETYPL